MKKLPLIASIMGVAVPSLVLGQSDGPSFELEEVVVTAQRREETLQSAAIPINAASGEDLLKAGISDATGLGKISPALTINTGGGANAGYFVRGVGNFNNNGYTNPAVAFNLDGVYIGRPSSTIASFLDLNRVEVLKGPQGTLYGRNATGGAINVHPNKPEIGENGGSVSIDVGDYGKHQLTGIVNVATGDNSAIRFASTMNQLDGYFDDDTGELQDSAFRLQFYSEVSDTFNYRLSADYSTSQGNGPGIDVVGAYGFSPFTADTPVPNWPFTPFNGSEFSGLHSAATQDFIRNNATIAPLFRPIDEYAFPFRDDTYWGVNAEFNWDLGFADLVVIPSYRVSELDNQFNGPPFKAAINQDEAKQFSLETRLSGSTDSFDWLLGAYFFDENVEGLNSFNQFSTTSFNGYDSDVESAALFARGTFNLTDTTRLVGGVRYTTEDREIDAFSNSLALPCTNAAGPVCPGTVDIPTIPVALTIEESLAISVANGQLPAGTTLPFPPGPPTAYGLDPAATVLYALTANTIDAPDESESEVTYRVAIEHDFGDDSLFYASFETGYRAGGYNLTIGKETYEPEYIDAFTIGTKNRFLDNRLELNAEAFYWEYEDQILAALGIDANGNNSFYSRNVGESTIAGLEVDFQYLAAENTLVRGGVQFLDTEYENFVYNQNDLSDDTEDPPNFLTPVTGCEYTQVVNSTSSIAGAPGVIVRDQDENGDPTPVRSYDIDCSGEEALFSPKVSVNLGLDQTYILDNGAITASFDLRHRDERWVGFGFLPGSKADSVTTLDASLSYENDNGLLITLYGRNLSDEYIPATFQVGAGSVAGTALEPPRTLGLRVSYDF
jgi:iron complex outermembrane receptor protein